MKSFVRIFWLAFVLYGVSGLAAGSAAYAPNVPSNDYLNALQAADNFAWAWMHRDGVAGAKSVTPAVRAKAGASSLSAYFVGTSSPEHYAFEIGAGKLVRAGIYRFPVRLLEYLFAGGGFRQSPAVTQLTIAKGTNGDWRAANLP